MHSIRLASLVARCCMPIYNSREEVQQTVGALVELSSHCSLGAEIGEFYTPLSRILNRDPNLVAPLFLPTRDGIKHDDFWFTPGGSGARSLALLLRALPSRIARDTTQESSLTQSVIQHTIHGLKLDSWPVQDVKSLILEFQQKGGCYGQSLIAAVEAYASLKLASASEFNFVDILSIAFTLPELTSKGSLLQKASARALTILSTMNADDVGRVGSIFNRSPQYRNDALVRLFHEQSHRVIEESKGRGASLQLFAFISRHEVSPDFADTLQCFLEPILGDEKMEAESFTLLCESLAHIPSRVQANEMAQAMADSLEYLCEQVSKLLLLPREKGGLNDEKSSLRIEQFFLPFFYLIHPPKAPPSSGGPEKLDLPQAVEEALRSCAAYINDRIAPLMESAIPPLRLISSLLSIPSPPVQRCGLALMREAAKQHLQLSALQTFEWLRLIGDHALKDREVRRFLRNALVKTNAEMPSVQFCTALKCLSRAADDDAEKDDEDEDERAVFLEFCTEKIRGYFSGGLTLACAIALAQALARLGCRDARFYAALGAFIAARRRRARAEVLDAEAAREVGRALDGLSGPALDDLRGFLREVGREGARGESGLAPTAWMDLHDPAHALAPRTPAEREGWAVLEAMRGTRADAPAALVGLAAAYLALLPRSRPDDLREFFAIFAEKGVKEDRVLKDGLDGLLAAAVVRRLAGETLAGILHSLAELRFGFSGPVKRLLREVSAEQWGEMAAAPLVQILAAMARLSLRPPPVLAAVAERLAELAPFLSPQETAQAIRSLQALGFPDEARMDELIRHAAASAARFDEASLVLLFTAPSIHRLLRAQEVARPLVKSASAKVSSLPLRQRIAVAIRKAGLPRELIEASSVQLGIGNQHRGNPPLRLT